MLGIILYENFLGTRRVLKFIFSLVCSLYFGVKLNLLLNVKTCPDCYETDMCHYFHTKQIQFTWSGYISMLFNPKFTKSVFHAKVNDSTDWVVLKRKFRTSKKPPSGDLRKIKQAYLLDDTGQPQNVILCPGFEDLQPFFQYLEDSVKKGHLWLDLSISIEPLLLRASGKFPVPRYLGACGDYLVEEYKGLPLTNFFSSDFLTRAHLSAELLRMAQAFTFGSSEFVFYFTDVSQDNLVVDSSGNVYLIDLDNVIILDKKNNWGKRTVHTSEIFDVYEYAYSPSDICSHHLSDHNYFTVCTYLLTNPENGLLRVIPLDVMELYPQLRTLMNACRNSETIGGRISAGEELKSLLELILRPHTPVRFSGT